MVRVSVNRFGLVRAVVELVKNYCDGTSGSHPEYMYQSLEGQAQVTAEIIINSKVECKAKGWGLQCANSKIDAHAFAEETYEVCSSSPLLHAPRDVCFCESQALCSVPCSAAGHVGSVRSTAWVGLCML